jgi:hypothetical protein
MKPVDEMSMDEIEAERALIRAERQRRANAKLEAVIFPPDELEGEKMDTDDSEPAPWPHEFGVLGGHRIEVRRPSPAALVAISMTGSSGMESATQMRVFTTFMVKHISPNSLDLVLGLMADPDSGVDMQDVISALTNEVPTQG